MTITGIEVIRRNPGMAAVGVPVGEMLPVSVGDTVRVHMTVDYRGLAVDGAIWTAIGWQVVILGFVEVFNSRTAVSFDESLEFVTYPIVCDVPITEIEVPQSFDLYGNILDMYAKIMEVPGPDIFTDINMGVIEVAVEVPPEPELIQHTVYPFAYVYDGDVEVTTATFKTDPFTPSAWAAQKFADALESEVEKEGGRVIELKVYVDTSPLFWTNFRVEVVSTPLGAEVASGIAVGIAIWLAILIIALAIIAVIVVLTLAIKTITELFKHKGLTPELKEPMSRGTLIRLIYDFEVKLERTPTPAEDLEKMSDGELREYCDQLAEVIAKEEEEFPWELVIIGGLAVLGVGAVALTLTRRPGGEGHHSSIVPTVAAATALRLEEERRKKEEKEKAKAKGLRW